MVQGQQFARAAETGLRQLRRPEDVARLRGKRISEILPRTAAKIAAEAAEAAASAPGAA